MKMFGGGNLLNDFDKALNYALSLKQVHSFAVGMQSKKEIDSNIAFFSGIKPSEDEINYAISKKRKLIIEDWCIGCGECVKICKSDAIMISDNQAIVDNSKCVLCSYCARGCGEFAIKVV